MPANLENIAVATGLERSVFIPIPKKGNAKECSNYHTIAVISHACKIMLKILQVRLQQYLNCKLPDVQTGCKKAEEPEIKLPTSVGSSKSKRVLEKHLLLLYWIHQSLWLCGSQQIVENFKRWEHQITLPASWEICMQVKKQQLGPEMEKWTGSKLGKEYVKAVYCHPAYLTSMQSTSCEMLGWMKHKLESRLLEETSITSDMQSISPLWQKTKKN